ncbi:hypothetical protein Tco_0140619 [Tanacetum coccineum]
MAQQIEPADQLVSKFRSIGRCNNYFVLQSIPCSPECKIVGKNFLDHPLNYALTATTDVPGLDTQEITYTIYMFCATLKLPVETPDNPFVAPVTIDIIESFMNKKKEAIQYPRFIKLMIADLMKKFPNIPQRIDEDYHSIKDDIPLVSVYTTGNVLVRGMLIPDEFLTKEIRATDDFKEYETVFMNVVVPMNQPQPVVSTQGTHRSTPIAYRTPTVTAASPQGKKRKQTAGESSSPHKSLKITIKQNQVVEGEKDDDDSEDRLEPGSHEENPEHVDDDDDEEKVDETKDADMGSLETRTEEMQTPIPTPPRSPRTILSSDKNITQELTELMYKRQGYMIQNMERKCVTTKYFWKTHKKVDRVLHEIVPQLAERATDDLIENSLKPSIAVTIIKDRDAFRSEVPDLVSQEFNVQAPKIIEELFKNYVQSNVIQVHPTTTTSTETTSSADLQQQLYLKMKRSLQDQANDLVLWEVLKCKFVKFSTSNTSCRDDDLHSQRHDDHHEDDAPPEGEKRVKRHKASKSSKSVKEETVIDEDEVISEDETPELITKLQIVDKHVPTILDRARMEATLNDMLSNQFKNAEEYAYHLEQATNFMENQIVWESRQEDIIQDFRITTDQPHGLDFMEQIIVKRENDKPDSFSEADFKYLNKNDIEDLYYLCWNKKVNYCETKLMNSLIMFIRSRVMWERVHDFKLGIESYQVNVNLTAPTLTFPGIEAYEPYSIFDKPNMSLIYLNSKDEKRVKYLVEIVKFCDATLEKVLKEVKLKIFQSEP